MAKELDSSIQNSTGYFADPVTKAVFTGEEHREQTCPDEKTFMWPKVKTSDGKVVRLASKLWNETERKAYYAYKKSLGTDSGTGAKPKKSKAVDTAKLDELDSFLKTKLKGEDLEQALALTKALRPEDPAVAKARKMVDTMTEEQKTLMLTLLSAPTKTEEPAASAAKTEEPAA